MCSPYNGYQKINPQTQLMIIAECTYGCTDDMTLRYKFGISTEWKINPNDTKIKWIECVNYACIYIELKIKYLILSNL